MQLLAQYPISHEHITPYVGRPVAALLPGGDIVCGVIDRIHEGHIVMKPVQNLPEATVASLKKSLQNDPRVKNRKVPEKVSTKAFGYPGAYPYGWGYGNYGWGAGWWWIFPLFALAAIAAFPFFW